LLMRILASDFTMTVAQLTRGALFVLFVDIYMGLPTWSSGLFLVQFVFGIAAGPIWMFVGRHIGKHRAAIVGKLAQTLINLGLLFLTPGERSIILVLTIAQGLAQGSGNLMLRSMVADVADQHRLHTGEDRTALFFSVFSISMKTGMAVAVGIALPLVSWLGFDPHVAHNSPSALHGLLLTFALGPAILHALAALCVSGFPLDAAAHERVRQQLAEREVESILN
jgi:Na+/melibiose symporter-like transporter